MKFIKDVSYSILCMLIGALIFGGHPWAENEIIEGLGWLSDTPEGRHWQQTLMLNEYAVFGSNGVHSRDYIQGKSGVSIYYIERLDKWIIEADGWISRPQDPSIKDQPEFMVEGMNIELSNPRQAAFYYDRSWHVQNLYPVPDMSE